MYHAHGGFVIGSESFGGVRNVAVLNCVFVGTDVGLRFKSARDRGGLVEKLFIDGVRMRDIATDAILFDMYYAGGAPDVEAEKDLTVRTAQPVTDRTPQFRDISIRNVVCDGAKRALVINGLPEMPVRDIVLDSVFLTTRAGVFLADAENILMNGCRFYPATGPVLSVIQSRGITVQGGTLPGGVNPLIRLVGENSSGIKIKGIDASGMTNAGGTRKGRPAGCSPMGVIVKRRLIFCLAFLVPRLSPDSHCRPEDSCRRPGR